MVHRTLNRFARLLGALFATSVCLLVAIASFFPTHASAFGITPPTYSLNVARGSSFTTKVSLQKEVVDKDKDIPITVLTSGDNQGVISLEESRFIIPAGELWHAYQVRGHVSDKVANGSYRIKVVFRQENSVAVGQGGLGTSAQSRLVMQLPLILNVAVSGEQVVSSTFIAAQIPQAEVDDPLVLNADFKNMGNVAWKPDEIIVRVYRVEDTARQTPFEFRLPVSAFIDPSLAFTYHLEFAHNLAQGRYQGTAFAIQQGKPDQQRPIAPFEILSADFLAKKLLIKYVSTDQAEYFESDPNLLEVAVENLGAVRTKAVTHASLYLNGRMVASQDSAPQVIERGETALVRFRFEKLAVGSYEVRVYADYDGKSTPTVDKPFVILPRPVEASIPVLGQAPVVLRSAWAWLGGSACMCFPYWLLLLILLLLLLILWLLYRRYRRVVHERDEARMDCAWAHERTKQQVGSTVVVHESASTPSAFSDVQHFQPTETRPPQPPAPPLA